MLHRVMLPFVKKDNLRTYYCRLVHVFPMFHHYTFGRCSEKVAGVIGSSHEDIFVIITEAHCFRGEEEGGGREGGGGNLISRRLRRAVRQRVLRRDGRVI